MKKSKLSKKTQVTLLIIGIVIFLISSVFSYLVITEKINLKAEKLTEGFDPSAAGNKNIQNRQISASSTTNDKPLKVIGITIGGIAGGTVVGAGVGTVIPGLGTGVGAVGGGIIGGIGGMLGGLFGL